MEHWEKLRDLGKGGFGIVSLWRNTQNSQLLALKCCKSDEGLLDQKTKDNWCHEVDKMSKLNHRNIIRVLPLPETLRHLSKLPILCMEFCMKGDLRRELCKPENICGLREENVRAVMNDVKAGVEYLHSVQIIHRDLKPENIVLHEVPHSSNAATKIVYKLIDLGFAKEWDHSSLCDTFVGTLPYIAPELFTQDTKYSRSVDYWSLGMICHEIVTGFRPFIPDVSVPKWLEIVRKKSRDHICIYETVDGTIEYSQEIFPENRISQPLKYALENWLRIALEWDGSRRGKKDNSLVIFSSLESALKKKIVTVYCVSRLERLSYEIYESTLADTLKLWVERDTDIPVSNQLVLLPSGSVLDDLALVISHYDDDPNLVAMLYVISKSEGVRLPSVQTLQSKHPLLVAKMLESPSELLPYQIIRRTWANSVYFIQSILENYKAFIEAYSVKILSLMRMQEDLLKLQREISSALPSLQASFQLSKMSLNLDLKKLESTHYKIIGKRKSLEWESPYTTIEAEIERHRKDVESLFQSLTDNNKLKDELQEFGEPGVDLCDSLSLLLNEATKLYCSLIKIPVGERDKRMNSLPMAQLIFQLWEIISKIALDEAFEKHLQELARTESEVTDLIAKMRILQNSIRETNKRISVCQKSRQDDIWHALERNVLDPVMRDIDQPPALPPREAFNGPQRIPLGDHWRI